MDKEYIDKHEAYMLLKHEVETHELPASKEAYERAMRIIDMMKPCASRNWIPVWVDCEEAMPADYERVLVLFKDNLHDKTFCGVAFWGRSMKRNGQFTWMFPVFPMQYDSWLIPEWAQCEVTHWMPLPSTDGLDGR